jgi:hypothetical protein
MKFVRSFYKQPCNVVHNLLVTACSNLPHKKGNDLRREGVSRQSRLMGRNHRRIRPSMVTTACLRMQATD